VARVGAVFCEAPVNDSGQMGEEERTRGKTWQQIMNGADKIRTKDGAASQIVARVRAVFCGAPVDASGHPTDKARDGPAVDGCGGGDTGKNVVAD